ncbi:unnamed protein product [Orchesella dallaii]|uniref:Uncharacterized protein n=1 Tax=Orchesella dallaii TaxID=48710 RepID=A0ABP1RR46_9HEXA
MSVKLFEIFDHQFTHPFSLIIAGMSMSGKTYFTKQLIENREILIKPTPIEVIVCYSEDQQIYSDLKVNKHIKFIKGLDFDFSENQNPKLLIIDDQMTSSAQSKEVQELFIKGVHHKNVSLVFITQNLFNQGRYARDMRLNAHYLIVFKSPMFLSSVGYLSRQFNPTHPKFVLESYKDATKKPYSYLFINLHPNCDDELRIRTGILPNESEIVYVPT